MHKLAIQQTVDARVSRALGSLRRDLIRNSLRIALSVSRLRLATILFCSIVFWSGLFFLFYDGFQFIGNYMDLANTIVEYLFSMFFLSLFVMLFFSTGIITYAALFHSRESTFLLTTPATEDRIFAHKFVEAIGFSSWGFFLLGSPLMVAYGLQVNAPVTFYAVFLLYLVAFVLLSGSLGGIAAIVVANIFPKSQKVVLGGMITAALSLVVYLTVQVLQAPGERMSGDWLGTVLGRLAFCQNPLWPSRWMSAGLLASARGAWKSTVYYLVLLSAHAGLGYLAAAVTARDLYRRGYSRVQGGAGSRRKAGSELLDSIFHRAFFFLPRQIRLLILKDLRNFLRDPAQWSQFLIFFGLLAFYFLNIRRLSYDLQSQYWRNLISFLNLSVTALLLSTFTSRFIFPLLSLEGRNFWVLGLLPLRRDQILWGKFAFSTGISLVATEVLVLMSDLMLRMSPLMIALHVGMVAVLCMGLSGISVGLGARFPNLRENNPSKIAAGFGGTLNLLVSLVFIFAIVTSLALPCHLYFAGQEQVEATRWALTNSGFRIWLGVAIMVSLVVGVLGTIVPLRIGMTAFQRMEL